MFVHKVTVLSRGGMVRNTRPSDEQGVRAVRSGTGNVGRDMQRSPHPLLAKLPAALSERWVSVLVLPFPPLGVGKGQ